MNFSTIAVMSAGDMGHAVGRAVRARGFRVITALAGRSAASRRRAERAGLDDVGTLENLVAEADLVLSIMPPDAAVAFAEATADAMRARAANPLFADCNAIAPATSRRVGEIAAAAGAGYIDGGIIGPPPGTGSPPRLYVSGPEAERLLPLAGRELEIHPLGAEIGRASALKMCYAALTKGTMTLDTAVLLAGRQLGVYDELKHELATSQQAAFARMEKRVPWLAAASGRWVGEMEEIARTFDATGLPAAFHQAAAEIFRLMAATELASETSETADRSRTLDQAVDAFAAAISAKRRAAE